MFLACIKKRRLQRSTIIIRLQKPNFMKTIHPRFSHHVLTIQELVYPGDRRVSFSETKSHKSFLTENGIITNCKLVINDHDGKRQFIPFEHDKAVEFQTPFQKMRNSFCLCGL